MTSKIEEPIFIADIGDAQAFRAGIDFAQQFIQTANMCFSKDGIKIMSADSAMKVMLDIDIYAKELLKYKYDSYGENGKLLSEVQVGVNLEEMYTRLKTLKAKSAISIYMKPSDDKLYVQLAGDVNTCYIFKTYSLEEKKFDKVQYTRDEPNIKITPDTFSKAMSKQCAGKCKTVKFTGYSEGVVLRGCDTSDTVIVYDHFGTIPFEDKKPKLISTRFILEEDEKDIGDTVVISGSFVKSLAKIGTVGGKSVVKIYCEKGQPLGILTSFGSFGEFKIYIMGT